MTRVWGDSKSQEVLAPPQGEVSQYRIQLCNPTLVSLSEFDPLNAHGKGEMTPASYPLTSTQVWADTHQHTQHTRTRQRERKKKGESTQLNAIFKKMANILLSYAISKISIICQDFYRAAPRADVVFER